MHPLVSVVTLTLAYPPHHRELFNDQMTKESDSHDQRMMLQHRRAHANYATAQHRGEINVNAISVAGRDGGQRDSEHHHQFDDWA